MAQRTRSYDRLPSELPTKETYRPIPSTGLLKVLAANDAAPEYARILPYHGDIQKIGDRVLTIVSDNVIEMQEYTSGTLIQAELIGDTFFIFNALLAHRTNLQPMRSIANFGSGFRGSHSTAITGKIATQLQRPISALDHFALETTGDIMVDRTRWGAGSKGNVPVMYRLKEDIAIFDTRNPQQ